MNDDPIVAEVRKYGEQLAEQAHGNLHEFFENLRLAQRKYSDRPVSAPPPRPRIREAVGKNNPHGEPSVSCELTEA